MLADDHHVVREGLRALFKKQHDLTVTGEAKNGREVADIAERLKPHVLVLDLMMPGLNGLEIICQVCRRAPATRIVVLSMYADAAYGVQALRNGAPAYVLKSANAGEIVKAVRKAMAGRRYLSPGALPAGRPGLRREDPGRRARHVRDADLARTGGAPPRRGGPRESGDRRAPRHQRAHGRDSPRESHAQARPA